MKANKITDVWKFIDMPTNGDPSPCWNWTGTKGGRDGRGYFSYRGVKWLAYRFVYSLLNGDIPDGDVVRHRCDNHLCCNPYHLELGSQSDNENDKYDRDRYGFPLKVVERVVELEASGQFNNTVIAAIVEREYGVRITPRRVSEIRTGDRRAKQSEKFRRNREE